MHGEFVIGETALPRAKRTEGSSVVGAKAKGSILSIVPGQCYKAMSPYPHSFAQYISCSHARNVEMAGMQAHVLKSTATTAANYVSLNTQRTREIYEA